MSVQCDLHYPQNVSKSSKKGKFTIERGMPEEHTLFSQWFHFKSLPNYIYFDSTKLKSSTGDRLNVAQIMESDSKRVKNMVGKGKKKHHFPSFPKMLSVFPVRLVKLPGLSGKGFTQNPHFYLPLVSMGKHCY